MQKEFEDLKEFIELKKIDNEYLISLYKDYRVILMILCSTFLILMYI